MRINKSNLIKLFSLTAVFVVAVIATFLLNSPHAQAGVPGDLECHWVDSEKIICTYNSNLGVDAASSRENETDCSGTNPYTCVDFHFQAAESAAFGQPVFKGGDDNIRWIYFTTGEANAIYYVDTGDPAPAQNAPTNARVSNVSKSQTAAEGNKCSILNPGTCDGYDEAGLDTAAFNEKAAELAELEELSKTCESKAPLGFIFCPVLEAITEGIGALIGGANVVQGQRQGLLIDFLKLPVLTVSQPNALNSVLQAMINVANVFYVIIFLVLIFSSSLPFGLDNYTVKKMLPKFIAAVILTQFSSLICAIVIDIFNLLGLLVPNIIFALTQNAPGGVTGIDGIGAGLQETLQAGLVVGAVAWGLTVGWIIILVFAIIALVAAFIAVIYMIIRFMVLYVLVLLSPLAFASWVLPGTEKFFYSWWKNFIRLNAVFMVITGLLATSIVLARVLSAPSTNTGPGAGVGIDKLIAALLPIAALLLIPKTLKWTTDGMNKLASGVLGAVPGGVNKAGTAGAKSAGKATKEGVQNKAAESKFGQTKVGGAIAGGGFGALLGTRGGKRRVAAREGQLRSERAQEAAIEHGKYRSSLGPELEGVKTASENKWAAQGITGHELNKRVAKDVRNFEVSRASALVAETGKSKSARFALMAQAAQSGDTATLQALQMVMTPQDWAEGVNNNYGAFDGVAPYRTHGFDAQGNSTGGIESDVSKLSYAQLNDLGGGMQAEIGTTHMDHLDGQVFIDASKDVAGRSKVNPKLRQNAVAWAAANPGHPKAAQINSVLDAQGNWK